MTTATAPATTDDAIEISTFYVREASTDALVDAMYATGARIASKLPGLAVHVVTTDPADGFWCAQHRSWAKEGKSVCTYLGGATQTELEMAARCYIAPARLVEVKITATGLPMWGDWDVLGVLTVSTTGAITATPVADRDAMLDEGHIALAGQCAHCGRARRRTTTVLLHNIVTDEVRPVGKSCLADYTGSAIRFEALALLTSLAERFNTSFGVTMGREPQEAPTVDVVALAIRYIALRGKFISKSNCNWKAGERPTSQDVHDALSWTEKSTMKVPAIMATDLTDADRAAARQAIAAVLAVESDSPYAVNLRAAAEVEWTQVDGKGNTLGLLASLPGSAERAAAYLARKAARDAERAAAQAQRVNAWIGEEKQRREFTGTVTTAKTVTVVGFSGYDEDKDLVVIDTPEGTIKLFGTVNWPTEVTLDELVGKTVTVTGTIAKHEEYQGHRQTKLNRAKVTSIS